MGQMAPPAKRTALFQRAPGLCVRKVFGVGRGYHTREVETFGSPMLDGLHSETFSHQGKHYTLPPAVPYRGYELRELTLVPRARCGSRWSAGNPW